MNHYELCKLTAEKMIKKSDVVLYEYQNWATAEFPDVLCFKNNLTMLYEVKVDRSDFLADKHKDCRKKWKNLGHFYRLADEEIARWRTLAPELMYIEKPHLGRRRYYVCPSGLIEPAEVDSGWGLIWEKNGKFFNKKESKKFQRNIFGELAILTHAMRKYASGNGDNILIHIYEV